MELVISKLNILHIFFLFSCFMRNNFAQSEKKNVEIHFIRQDNYRFSLVRNNGKQEAKLSKPTTKSVLFVGDLKT